MIGLWRLFNSSNKFALIRLEAQQMGASLRARARHWTIGPRAPPLEEARRMDLSASVNFNLRSPTSHIRLSRSLSLSHIWRRKILALSCPPL